MKNKKLTLGLAIVVAIAVVFTGTFAWFSTEKTVLNKLSTDGDNSVDTEIVENFPNKVLEPGVEVTKEVHVVQTGTGKAITRVRFEEALQMFVADTSGKELKVTETASATPAANQVPKKMSREAFDNKIAAAGFVAADKVIPANMPAGATGVEMYMRSYNKNDSNDTTVYEYLAAYVYTDSDPSKSYVQPLKVTVDTDNPEDPSKVTFAYPYFTLQALKETVHTMAPDTVIPHDILEMTFGTEVASISTWTGAPTDKWFYDTDGWFYWGNVLSSGSATELLLKSIEMSGDAGNEYFGSKYNINVRMQSVQPSIEAATAEWAAKNPLTVDPFFTTIPNQQGNMTAEAVDLVTALCS